MINRNSNIYQFIENMPKAELHIHIEGSMRPERMLQLADRNQVQLPYQHESEIRAAYQFTELSGFLEMYYAAMRVLKTEQDFYDLTWDYIETAQRQHVYHAEIFFDPQIHLKNGVSFPAIMDGMTSALADAKKHYNMSSHLIMCFIRDMSVSSAHAVLDLALAHQDKIIAVGLDSKEIGHPPAKFATVFARAREYGFLTVAHAGEEGPVENIWQALEILKVARIDHGVRCVEDTGLMHYLAQQQIPLTICPLSNAMITPGINLHDHPLKAIFDAGICATINSDDPAYFGGHVNENYVAMQQTFQFTKTELYQLAKNSFTASFLEAALKQQYITILTNYYRASLNYFANSKTELKPITV